MRIFLALFISTLAFAQLSTPALEIPTVTLDQVPPASVIVPRSRFWSAVRVSGFTTVTLTVARWVMACAGALNVTPATARSSIENRR